MFTSSDNRDAIDKYLQKSFNQENATYTHCSYHERAK